MYGTVVNDPSGDTLQPKCAHQTWQPSSRPGRHVPHQTWQACIKPAGRHAPHAAVVVGSCQQRHHQLNYLPPHLGRVQYVGCMWYSHVIVPDVWYSHATVPHIQYSHATVPHYNSAHTVMLQSSSSSSSSSKGVQE